jgi:hypothetical protein
MGLTGMGVKSGQEQDCLHKGYIRYKLHSMKIVEVAGMKLKIYI